MAMVRGKWVGSNSDALSSALWPPQTQLKSLTLSLTRMLYTLSFEQAKADIWAQEAEVEKCLHECATMAVTQVMSCAFGTFLRGIFGTFEGAKIPLKAKSSGTSLAPQWLFQCLNLLASPTSSAVKGNISPGEPTALFERHVVPSRGRKPQACRSTFPSQQELQ